GAQARRTCQHRAPRLGAFTMPQRTNPFQELVALIEHAFAKDGDKVTPSAMVKVHGLETEREVDILRETPNGLYTIKVALEAKDESRTMELTTFEGYLVDDARGFDGCSCSP